MTVDIKSNQYEITVEESVSPSLFRNQNIGRCQKSAGLTKSNSNFPRRSAEKTDDGELPSYRLRPGVVYMGIDWVSRVMERKKDFSIEHILSNVT